MSAMTMRAVPDGNGGMKHVPTPFVPTIVGKGKKKVKPSDPMQMNPDAAAKDLKLFIERLQNLHAERDEISADIRDVESEMSGQGFDRKVVRAIMAMLKTDKNDLNEFEALIETYRDQLGLV